MLYRLGIFLSIVLAFGSTEAFGSVNLFTDDFEGDLSAWVGKNEGAHSGVLFDDPLRPGNRVLTFAQLTGGGDVFSPEINVAPGMFYRLEFEYLGQPDSGTASDLGGFIGIAEETPGAHRWLDGTSVGLSGAENDSLIDDGQWHSYSLLFDPFDPAKVAILNGGLPLSSANGTIRLMLEDYIDVGGIAGDVFFDNVRLTLVPEPTSAWLLVIGLLSLRGRRTPTTAMTVRRIVGRTGWM